MQDFATHQFYLSEPVHSGKYTRKEHLQSIQQQGIEVPDLEPPELSDSVMYLWRWFLELHSGRQGTSPLSYSEIEAWARLKQLILCPDEVEALKKIDNTWIIKHRDGSR